MTDAEKLTEVLIEKAENMPEIVQLPPTDAWYEVFEQTCLKFIESGEACSMCKEITKKVKEAYNFLKENENNDEVNATDKYIEVWHAFDAYHNRFKNNVTMLLACAHVGAVKVTYAEGEPVEEEWIEASFRLVLTEVLQPNPLTELLESLMSNPNIITIKDPTDTLINMLESSGNIDKDLN